MIEELYSQNLNLSFERIKRKIVSSNNVLNHKLIQNLANMTHQNSEEISSHLKENSDNTQQKILKLIVKKKKNLPNHLKEESK